ncbi:MAG: aminotransferase class V-fold PLP-dependent enzyme, partial [Cyclobacteriaceae bacterium]|nr:aminotransferase class V-fold PLP-dependent enzyme [Cyclobacteriaceae bacterium]
MECQSHRFGIPDDIAYLNCAYMGPLTHETVAAGHQAMLRKQQPFTIGVQDFFEPVDGLKQNFATLVNAPEPLRISVMPSVSYGLATVAKNLPVSKGENVIALEEQFPSNIYCWTRLCKEQGMELRIISAPHAKKGRGKLWNTKILDSIDEKTAAVAVGTVHWADGTLFDLKAIRKRTREVGAMLIVDGTQTVGAMPFDMVEINPDALICAGYKWLLGPYSLALAYFGPAFDGGIPLEENWINRIGSDDFKGLVRYQEQYHPYAVRY